MNLRDLDYLIALADHGHFGRAAAACHVSQPTLSGQVRKLEGELGVAVFERDGRRLRPTPVGEQLIAEARRAAAAAVRMRALARAHADPLVGPVRLGAIPTLAPYLLPGLLDAMAARLPAMPPAVREALTAELEAAVEAGELDAALTATAPALANLVEIALFDEPFRLMVSRDHLLGRGDPDTPVPQGAIRPDELLLLADGHCLRDQALAACARAGGSAGDGRGAGVEGAADLRAAGLETLVRLAAAGRGLTLVPALALEGPGSLDPRLVARPIAGAGASRRIRLIHRRGDPRRTAYVTLAEVVRESLPAAVAPASG
ncbi:MAG: LysR substrate-binding domain-containing protein [Azospirillaceae bacterium]